MRIPQGFKILSESANYILGNVYEYASIIDKRSGREIYIGASYGDPDFGLIDKNEKWALIFGHDSYLWTPTELIPLNDITLGYEEIFKWPFDARQVDDFEVEVLDDPWSDDPGVYSFNIKMKVIKRIRNFKTVDIPYDAYNKPRIEW